MNIGVLPVKVSENFLNALFEEVYKNPLTPIIIDLSAQKVVVGDGYLESIFEINSYKKNNLLHGFDDIDFLLNMKKEISDFAKNRLF